MHSGTPSSPVPPPGNGAGLRRLDDLRSDPSPYLRPAMLAPPPAPPALAGGLDPRALARGLRRRLGPALALGLLLAAPAVLGAWFAIRPAKYRAQALLRVAATDPRVFQGIAAEVSGPSEFANFQRTQEVLITSRRVLNAALENPDVAGLPSVLGLADPVDWLQEELDLKFTGEVLGIGLEGDRDVEVVALVNAVTDAYMAEVVGDEKLKSGRALEQLETFARGYREDLLERKENLRKMAEAAGSNNQETLAYKQQLAMQRLSVAENELRGLRAQAREARLELAMLDGRAPKADAPTTTGADAPTTTGADPAAPAGADPAAPAPESPPEAEVRAYVEEALAQDATLQGLRGRVAEARAAHASVARVAAGSDPALVRYRRDLDAASRSLEGYQDRRSRALARQYLDAWRQQGGAPPAVGASPSAAPAGASRGLLARRIEFLEAAEADKRGEVAALEEALKSLSQTTLDLEALRDDIRQAELLDAEMARKIAQERANVAAPERITLIEHATVAAPQSEKKRYMAAGMAGMGAFGFALIAVAWLDARARRVAAVDEVVRGLGMNLVGVLPSTAERPRRLPSPARGARARDPDDLLLESVNATRAMLLHSLEAESVRVLMVASAQKGEGKTSLACHLATSLARARRRTLLIDADLRSPTVHTLFDHPPGPGLAEVLRGEADADEVIQPTLAAGLSLIAAGRCDAAAVDSLAQGNFRPLLDRLRARYDYILVDTAPILAVSDSLHICRHADAAIFSVLRDVSRLPKIHEAYARLVRLGVRFLGAVVAGTPVDDYYDAYAYAQAAAPAPAGGGDDDDPAAPDA